MSVGKSSISRLSAEPKKPEAPEVPAPAVAKPADAVLKQAKKAVPKAKKPAAKAPVRSTVLANPTPAVSHHFANVESYAFGEELPYWLL